MYKGSHSGRAQVRGLLSVTTRAATAAGQMSEAYRALGQPQWQGRGQRLTVYEGSHSSRADVGDLGLLSGQLLAKTASHLHQ